MFIFRREGNESKQYIFHLFSTLRIISGLNIIQGRKTTTKVLGISGWDGLDGRFVVFLFCNSILNENQTALICLETGKF